MQSNSFSVALHFHGKSPEPLPPDNIFGPVVSQYYLLQYCSTGQGVMEVDGRNFPLKKGECIVTFPGQQRTEQADHQDPWAFIWIALQGHSAQTFFEKMGMTPDNPILPDCGEGPIPRLMEQIVDIADALDTRDDFLLGAKLFSFFDTCLQQRTREEKTASTGNNAESYTTRAICYLHSRYTRQNLTIAGLAKHLGLNRSYLYEIFKGQTGLSPQEYLTRLRIHKSCALLQNPLITVKDAAHSVGYEPSVFSKAFLRTMGMSPVQYKQNYK